MPDPDLEIRRGGRGSSRPLDKGGRSPPPYFLALRASFWSKNRGVGQPPGSLPWIRHYIMIFGSLLLILIPVWWCMWQDKSACKYTALARPGKLRT